MEEAIKGIKNSYVLHQNYQMTTFENMTEETLETMK